MKIYLAGPMRGYPESNFPAFDFAAAKLRAEGHEVFSPAECDREQLKDGGVFSLRKALRADTEYITLHSDAVALLPGWEKSKGAVAEAALAVALGLETRILGKEYT